MAVTGRPRKYDSHDSFAAKVDEYFASLEQSGKRPTLAGLSYFMDFEDREAFGRYADYGDEFSRTVKQTRLRIEDDRWQSLIDKGEFTPGLIFDLKNNHGWKDTVQQEVSGPNGTPIQQTHSLDTANLTDDQLRALASIKV